MTGSAGIGDTDVIEYCHYPTGGAVTGIADLHCGDMCRRLARSDNAIMTTPASANDLTMVDQWIHRCPCGVNVAGLAHICGIDVGRRLTAGQSAIMTADAALRHRGMTKRRNGPVAAVVTSIAGLYCGDMGGRFPRGDDAIVTALTGTDDFPMIHPRIHRRPRRVDMTGFTSIRGINVSG